jgi:hypothetical protein
VDSLPHIANELTKTIADSIGDLRQQVAYLRQKNPPQVDAIRALPAALKVLGRRFGLRAISIRVEAPEAVKVGPVAASESVAVRSESAA